MADYEGKGTKITAQSFSDLKTALLTELKRRSGNGSVWGQYEKLSNISDASANTKTTVEQ